MTDQERKASLRRLRFPEPLEGDFQDTYFARTLMPLRVGFGLISLVLIANFVRNVLMEPVTPASLIMVGAPTLIFGLTFLPSFRRFWQPCLALIATSGSLFLIYFNMTNPEAMRYFPDIVTQMTRMAYTQTLFMTVALLMIRLPFVWTTLCLAAFEGFGFYWASVLLKPEAGLMAQLLTNTLLVALALMLATLSLERYHRSDFIANRLLEEERAKSERLLLNVLPASVAERLKTNPEAIADSFAEVTVLFADIVGFTPMAAAMPPLDLVGLLNRVFSRFDELTEKYGLERIKTIGDAYMVAGGLPTPKADHATAVSHLALEMMDVVREFPGLQLRIGIHMGAVVAGVIGTKRFLYDLWGDTVNVAGRMESHGSPGTILVTESVRTALSEKFAFGPPTELDVKGKGRMAAYALIGTDE